MSATLRAVEKRKNPGRANPGRVSVQRPEGAAPAAGTAFVRRLRRAQVLEEHLRDAGACTPHIVSKSVVHTRSNVKQCVLQSIQRQTIAYTLRVYNIKI